jgi:hypothetical protein
MLTTDQFFAGFKAAGMTVPAAWTPSGGGPQQTADVIFRARGEDPLGGDAIATAYAILYPATKFVGLKRGETVIINGGAYTGVSFKVREEPKAELDGSRMRAMLEK